MQRKLFKFVAVIVTVFLLVACSNNQAVSPSYIPGWKPPVVKGMILTNESGLQIGIFGNPEFPENVMDKNPDSNPGKSVPATLLGVSAAYPNPGDGRQTIHFSISRASKVKVWVSPARWINEPVTNKQFSIGGSLVDIADGRAIEVLLNGTREYPPGTYAVSWDSNNNTPMAVPMGFYRIYVQANGVTLWRDIYECARFQKAPYGLHEISEECR